MYPGILPSSDLGVGGGMIDQWAGYGYPDWMSQYSYYGAEMGSLDQLSSMAPLYPSAALDGLSGVDNGAAAPEGVVPVSASGMENDSPRSVLLTLCGAWGALKTTGPKDGDGALLSTPSTKKGSGKRAKTPISRTELLRFRRALPRGSRVPSQLKSLRCRKHEYLGM